MVLATRARLAEGRLLVRVGGLALEMGERFS